MLLELEDALDRFGQLAQEAAILFRNRCFLNCPFGEIAQIVGLSVSYVKRSYPLAKKWLERELGGYEHEGDVSHRSSHVRCLQPDDFTDTWILTERMVRDRTTSASDEQSVRREEPLRWYATIGGATTSRATSSE